MIGVFNAIVNLPVKIKGISKRASGNSSSPLRATRTSRNKDLKGFIRPGSKMCFEHMNNWQYLSLGDLEQNELFSKSKSGGFLVL